MSTETLSLSRVFTAVAAVGAAAALGYVVYFDYRRRHDPVFRRKLKEQRKAAARIIAARESELASSASGKADGRPGADLGDFNLDDDTPPTNPREAEEYFTKNFMMGESLLSRGPAAYEAAAVCFYRALRVHPEPMAIFEVLQKSLPAQFIQILVELMSADVKKKQDEYTDHYPAEGMHAKFVEEVQRTNAGGRRVVRRGVAVTVPVAAGGTVFSEDPIIAGLEIDSEMAVMSMAQAAMSCTHCLKPVGADSSTVADVVCPRCSAAFCSQECRDNGERLHHRMLCRDVAPAFFGLCTAEHDTPALLTAMFLTKMVDKELSQKKPESKYDDWDHLERMHDIRPELGDKERLECSLLKDLIAPGVSGFEAFLKEDRYLFIKSKIMHNAIAVPASGHTEAAVRAKTLASPGKTLRGRALYHITTFVSHSCEPNVAIRLMPETGARMSLVALKDLEPSEELFVSYVDPDMPYEQRKAVIRQQFGFVCKCAKCKRRE